ncbi:FAD-linked oxidase C-terminal domain-containing protein [Teichococcus aestuarii]|uniref:FAD-linked oxidase C-terminal domain-containing protein n=1 Tax=Teichococcus aestuarii TaxID=568898 RepID=UPI003623152B
MGDSEAEVQAKLGVVEARLAAEGRSLGRRGHTVAWDAAGERIQAMRKRGVGLLGNMQGERRPIAFVEDTAVPPENLADFIGEFRAALDRRGLEYGMFGHVDAGVLHVRPALDMKAEGAERMIREITDEVFALTRKYGGLLWGEHGKGVRSEYVPEVFGPLYPSLQAIKAAFDPRNQLNPGKIAAPDGEALLAIDRVPMRGQLDRTIPAPVRAAHDDALHCNGNGACFNYDTQDAMCPSYKATGDRRHSPKGRASLFREWLRQLSAAGVDPMAEAERIRGTSFLSGLPARIRNERARRRGEDDFSHAVKEAMDGCLACKSCTGQCPIKVDVPSFRAKFLEIYHGRYQRPLKDYLVGMIEQVLPLGARAPGLANAVLGSGIGRALAAKGGLVDAPLFSGRNLVREAAAQGVRLATPEALRGLGEAERRRHVVLVQDAFTTHFETGLVLDLLAALRAMGFTPGWRPSARTASRCMCMASSAPSAAGRGQCRHAARPGRERGGTGRPRPVDDADLPLRIQGHSRAAGAAAAGMAGRAPGAAARVAPGRGLLPAAALHGADQRHRLAQGMAGGVRAARRAARRAGLGLLRHGRHLWARGGAP